MNSPSPAIASRKPWYCLLYVQVLIAVGLGILVGHYWEDIGRMFGGRIFGLEWPTVKQIFKPLGDGFIKLIKMLIAPIIFCTVVHGVASMKDLKKLGRVGFKTLFYFEVVSTIALVLGLVVVNVLRPGDGFQYDPAKLDAKATQTFVQSAQHNSVADFLLGIIPNTFFGALTSGEMLPAIFVAVLAAFAISSLGERAAPVLHVIDRGAEIFFGIMRIVVRAAPIGAFGAMAFTIGEHGLRALVNLASLMAGFYLTAAVFVVVVLGGIAAWSGFSIFRFLNFIKEELLLVLGTSSSETALPGMIDKMKRLGCAPATVGLVIPTGYSFNLDGSSIYLTMAVVFLAQATHTPLDLPHQLGVLFIALITSKGSGGVTGAGFIALAATLAAVPSVPIESLALLIGIDRFMSECRAITNLIGNGVATVAISRWEGEVTKETLRERLRSV